jgi:glycosyltransferase involved in cell wall biosynthesis
MTENPKSHAIQLSLVIACYNEAPHLEESVREIEKVLAATRYSYELIFVDDCSQDQTREIIKKLCLERPQNTRSIFHAANTGRGRTVTDGFLAASGEIVGFIDIDLEVHCRYIPAMLISILNDEYDVATAFRIYELEWKPTFILRHILSVGYRILSRTLLGISLKDIGARCYSCCSIMKDITHVKNHGISHYACQGEVDEKVQTTFFLLAYCCHPVPN